MARYAYDVNTTTRLIDVHKQFQGGLKTVDTDDALGAVFLREAENVSLSEFGFIEKRYGTYENFKKSLPSDAKKLQGYFEFKNHAIFVVDGNFYVDEINTNGKVKKLEKEDQAWRYPELLFEKSITCEFETVQGLVEVEQVEDPSALPPDCAEGAFYYANCSKKCADCGDVWLCERIEAQYDDTAFLPAFQETKDMNGVIINGVLYIFTGTYPIYVKEVEGQLKFYLFSIDVPSYNEIVVVGHNVLEDNFEDLYFTNKDAEADLITQINGTSEVEYIKLEGKEKESFPKIPFVYNEDTKEEGSIDFAFSYDYNPNTVGFDNMFENNDGDELHFLELSEVFFRTSGVGASSLDFRNANLDDVTFNTLTNISDDLTDDFVVFDTEVLPKTELSDADLGATRGVGTDVHENIQGYFTNNIIGSGNITTQTPLIIGKEHIIKKEFNINKIDVDFEKKYAVQFEFLKTEDDPETGEDETLYEAIDFEGLKQGVIDYFNDVYEDTTLEWYVFNGSNVTESFVRPYNFERLTYYKAIKNGYKVVITPYNSEGAAFANRTTISHFDIEYVNKSYVFKLPENVFQSEDVAYYGISFENKVYYLVRNFYDIVENASPSLIVLDENYTLTPFNLDSVVETKEPIYLEAHTVFEIKKVDRDFFGTSLLNINLKNLLSGNYDFRFNYKLVSYVLEGGVLNKTNTVDVLSDIVYGIQITQERLQDYPGAENVPVIPKAVWSCNKVIEHFGKLMIWGSEEMPTAVFYSFPDRPTFFPSKFYLDFANDNDSPVEAITNYMNILVVQTADTTWGVRGNSGYIDSPAPYTPFTINPTVGTIAYKSVRPVRNHLFFLSKVGVTALKSLYAADEQYNIEYMDLNIRNIVPQDVNAVGIQFDNQYWLNFPESGITLRWYINKKAWVLDKYTSWNQFKGVFKWQLKDGKLEFITNKSRLPFIGNSYIYKIGVDYSLPTDLGEPVVAKFETSFLNQNYPFHPKNYKEAKLDFTLQNEYNLSKDSVYFEDNIEIDGTHYIDDITLTKNHRYRISYYNLPKDVSVAYTVRFYSKDNVGNTLPVLFEQSGVLETPSTDPTPDTQEHIGFVEFLAPNDIDGVYDIVVDLGDSYFNGIDTDVIDVTYDDVLNFLVWVVSENSTLNQDPISDYGQAKVNIDISLQDRLGDWEFGTTDFGKKVTAVQTIKLSGKGYNAKLYMEDYSKSKWTLESLGLTYKMKRARSR